MSPEIVRNRKKKRKKYANLNMKMTVNLLEINSYNLREKRYRDFLLSSFLFFFFPFVFAMTTSIRVPQFFEINVWSREITLSQRLNLKINTHESSQSSF